MDKKISRREALKRIGLRAIAIVTPFAVSSSIVKTDSLDKQRGHNKHNNEGLNRSYCSYGSYQNYYNYQNYINYNRYFNYINYTSYCSLYNPYPDN